MLHRLILKVSKFQLPPPKHLGTVVKNILGAIMPLPLSNWVKRRKLTAEVFKDKKFNDDNLTRVREGIRDVCKSYGTATVYEFLKNSSFSSQAELELSKVY